MLDNKVLIKEYVHGALKEFGFLSKLDIDKATEKINDRNARHDRAEYISSRVHFIQNRGLREILCATFD